MPLRRHRESLEQLWAAYHRRRYVSPDPLQFLYDYDDPADREVVGLIASSLAYGRVAQILRSVSVVLDRLGPRPARFVRDAPATQLRRSFADFRHRFCNGRNIAGLLSAAGRGIGQYGSLGACFAAGQSRDSSTVISAMGAFVETMQTFSGHSCSHLLPDPAKGSACKRLNLFLRWMVRRDDVDPGGWENVSPAQLVIPLDVHMHRIARAFGATRRAQPNLRAALEVTEAFGRVCPEDPVRYDFCLTRLGIRPEATVDSFLRSCGVL